MSRKFEYKKKVIGSLQGTPAGELEVELDIADLQAGHIVGIYDSFSIGAETVSCQVVAKDLDGTLNGTVNLVQSNDGKNWDDINADEVALTGANSRGYVEKTHFSGKYLGAKVEVGNITSGTLKLVFIIKHH